MKNITLKALAEQLNVSTATVSRAMNDQPGVSDELRKKVLETASEMGYTPDVAARSLATAKTHTIAFVVHKTPYAIMNDPFYPQIMEGAETYLSQHNYHILLSTVDDEVMANPETFNIIRENRVDGLILAGPNISSSFILKLVALNIPLVLVDNSLTQTAVNCILNDDEGGAYAATRHLLDNGHTKVVFLSGPQAWISNRERSRGYSRAMKEQELNPQIFYEDETTMASGKQLCITALEAYPDLTAICAVNDSVAIGAMRAARHLGKQCPEDICIVGFDDITWAQMCDPPLSTVRVFKRRMGKLAAQRILDHIEDLDAPPVRILVSTELIIRESCNS